MKSSQKKLSIIIILLINIHTVNSQVTVNSNGSLFVNSYSGNWSRANWTRVHYQNSCAYHLDNTYYGGDVFYVLGNGDVWTRNGYLVASDSTFKTNIQNISSSLDKIKNLRGVKYNLKYFTNVSVADTNMMPISGHAENVKVKKLEPAQYGLIAQEVEKVVPEAVKTMHDSTKAISYTSLIPILIEATKEQQTQIETLQKIVSDQEEEIINLKDCCDSKDASLKNASIQSSTTEKNIPDRATLYQNSPNPFTNDTEIKYYVPENIESATIFIHNLQGMEIKTYPVRNDGLDSVVINGSELKPGLYVYTLVVNDVIVDTKKMILTKK